MGTREDVGIASQCVDDQYEPNDDLPAAAPPEGNSECSNAIRAGSLAGDGDVDVFRTRECELSGAGPSARLRMTGEGSEPLRLCLFPVCTHGSTNVYSCYEDEPGDSPAEDVNSPTWRANAQSGFRGCCRTGDGPVHVEMDCGVFAGSTIETYIWVDTGIVSVGDPECRSYEVTYWLGG